MSRIKTAFEFAKNISTVGAFKQSSPKVEQEVCTKLSKTKKLNVVEFGLGHGNITKVILDRISSDSVVTSFEINEKFCEHVQSEMPDDRLRIVNDRAENFRTYVKEPVDFFIASLPFTFLSKEARSVIAKEAYASLRPGGYFSQYVYLRFSVGQLKEVFDEVEEVPVLNIPMEYVLHWKKRLLSSKS